MKCLLVILFSSISLIASGSADLEVRSLKAVPDPYGKTLHLELSIVNHGPANAVHVGCNVYAYSSQQLVLSQSFSLATLPLEETRTEAFTIELPSGTAVTRIKAEIYDSEEADVQPSTNFAQINIKPPDFKIIDLDIVEASIETPQPVSEKAVVIRLKLRNNGPDAVRNSKVLVDLQVFNASIATNEKKVGRLEAGEQMEIKIPVPLAKSISSTEGMVLMKWTVSDTEVVDPSEENNSYVLPVLLIPKMPDLIAKNAKLDRRGFLTFIVMNKGNAPSDGSVTALYVNAALTERFNTPALQPSAVRPFRYTGTKITPGAQVAIVADFNADVVESSEENNRITVQPD